MERNHHIRTAERLGRRDCHRWSGAYPRRPVENVFSWYKAILGRDMRARTLAEQRTEARIGAKIFNCMAQLGMLESYRVAGSV